MSAGFVPYAPGEEWGGGSPVDKCVACTSQGVLSEDTARSIQPGQDVDPTTGDFTTDMTLLDIPTAAGHFGISLTYDAQRAMQEARHHTAWPGNIPGPFGWGWSSDLSASVYPGPHRYLRQSTRPTGRSPPSPGWDRQPQRSIHASNVRPVTSTIRQVHAHRRARSEFCASARTDASFGTFSPFAYYQLDVKRREDSRCLRRRKRQVGLGWEPAERGGHQLHARHGRWPTTQVTARRPRRHRARSIWDTVSTPARRIVAETNAYGIVTTVFGPTGEQWQMGYTDSQAHLNTVTTPTTNVTNYSYAVSATATKGYNDEITKITDPDTNGTTIVYAAGMVTHTENAEAESTDYSYTRTNCASSTTGCSDSHTVTHPTGLLHSRLASRIPMGKQITTLYLGGIVDLELLRIARRLSDIIGNPGELAFS